MATELLIAFPMIGATSSWRGRSGCRLKEKAMTKLVGALLTLAALLLAAPVIESGTSDSTQWFQAIGTADGGDGGGP